MIYWLEFRFMLKFWRLKHRPKSPIEVLNTIRVFKIDFNKCDKKFRSKYHFLKGVL